jgi:hypothetical protein
MLIRNFVVAGAANGFGLGRGYGVRYSMYRVVARLLFLFMYW